MNCKFNCTCIRSKIRKTRSKRTKRDRFIRSSTHFSKRTSSSTSEMDTNNQWFWSNYHKSLEWQSKHKSTAWRSYALVLQQENRYLSDLLSNLPLSLDCPAADTLCALNEAQNRKFCSGIGTLKTRSLKNAVQCISSSDDDEELEFEVSEEMLKFFEQSLKHKLDMKESKQSKENMLDKEVKTLQEIHNMRIEEMKLLYGTGSSMIIGMETAVELSYDKYCDTKSPKYWPNIPLSL